MPDQKKKKCWEDESREATAELEGIESHVSGLEFLLSEPAPTLPPFFLGEIRELRKANLAQNHILRNHIGRTSVSASLYVLCCEQRWTQVNRSLIIRALFNTLMTVRWSREPLSYTGWQVVEFPGAIGTPDNSCRERGTRWLHPLSGPSLPIYLNSVPSRSELCDWIEVICYAILAHWSSLR